MKTVIKLIKEKDIDGLIKFYKENEEAEPLTLNELIPKVFKTHEAYKEFMHEFTIKYSIRGVKHGLDEDDLISVYVNFLDITEELLNEWYERVYDLFTLYSPEVSLKVPKLEQFLKLDDLSKESLREEFSIEMQGMGMEFAEEDMKLLKESINTLRALKQRKERFKNRLSKLVNERAPNTSKVAGEIVTARLIEAAGDLKRLVLMPSSTIQVIGAEKALFRHLRGNAKPPKHGVIFHSRFVSGVKPEHRGKMARALASKIAISTNVDYYKGEAVSDKLIKELEDKRSRLG